MAYVRPSRYHWGKPCIGREFFHIRPSLDGIAFLADKFVVAVVAAEIARFDGSREPHDRSDATPRRAECTPCTRGPRQHLGLGHVNIFPEPQAMDAPDVLPGMSLYWCLAIPMDLTGYTAQLVIDSLEASNPVTVTVNYIGPNAWTTLTSVVANTTTATWPSGPVLYRCILTAPSPSTQTQVAAYGGMLVLAPQGIGTAP